MERRFSGKIFSEQDITIIKDLIEANPNFTRNKLSSLVCQTFNWHKVNGELKDMSCRVAMIRMQEAGLIKLPKPRNKSNNRRKAPEHTKKTDPGCPIAEKAGEISGLNLEIVNATTSRLWNEYIDRYHYLKYNPLPGAQLRYLIKSDLQVLGCLGFGASAWKTAPRDEYITWNTTLRESNLHLIVNNARFLILPWVNSRNLASKVLSMVNRR